jgi:hypothetical protein
MELGFDIYFLIVFGFGSLLMLGLIVYFLREFIIRGDRPAWSARTLKSKFSYNVEPHHLRRRANQRDYAARMAEFFEYELKSGPKPAWMETGIPYLHTAEQAAP